ncbi:MAG: aldo/keto reductase, partial [Clostridia bacterium]|nr:aldo/keto reductase [Clostridia bacterium]
GFSHASGDPVNEATAVRTLREAFDIGYDFFDTAEAYTGEYPDGSISYNEELVGKALKGVRSNVVIATKMGVSHNSDRSLRLDSSPQTIRKSLEGSLRKLNTDYVDLYYQHRIDPKVAPETVAETMADLIREGKIRYWGISETTEEYLRRANAVCPVTAIENQYSMMARWHEHLFPVCEELNIAYVAFSPMANGILTGAYSSSSTFEGKQDYRANMPQYTEEGFAKAKVLLDYMHTLTEAKGITMSQLSLAWMLNKKPYIVPIPGSRKIERLKENFAAGDVTLTSEEIQQIDRKLDGMKFQVFGGHAAK